jgi:hypothetical protein
MFRKTFLASIICGLIAILTQPTSAAAATPSLAGSWQITLTPITVSPTPAAQIAGLATFTTDGSVIETDTSEVVPGVSSTSSGSATYGTPGHGIWRVYQPGGEFRRIGGGQKSYHDDSGFDLHRHRVRRYLYDNHGVLVGTEQDNFRHGKRAIDSAPGIALNQRLTGALLRATMAT